jgi:hypothetical protein
VLSRFVANLILGKLYPEAHSWSFLIFYKVLEHTNHSTVAGFVNDGLKVLWPQSIKKERVLVLYSDSAAYMLKAATALKVFYQNSIHFNCMDHGLQRVAEEVRSNFPDVNKLISLQKRFLKAPQRSSVTEISCLMWRCYLNRY